MMKNFKLVALIAINSLMAAGVVQAANAESKGGIKVSSDDGQFSGSFYGRIHLDGRYYNDDSSEQADKTEFRRLRLESKGHVFGDYGYAVQIDFGGDKTSVKDAYIKAKGFGPGTIKVGQFKQPIGLEELTSSNDISFMERALPGGLITAHKIGLGYDIVGEQTLLQGSVYGQGDDDADGNNNDQELGLGARFVYAPHQDAGNISHLGLSVAQEQLDGEFKVKGGVDAKFDSMTIAKFASGSVDSVSKVGLEGAIVRGPFSVQAEYLMASVEGITGVTDNDINAGYLAVSYFVTGQARNYDLKKGAFKGPKTGSNRAIELVGRMNTIENDDTGATADSLTLGANWYMNDNMRWMFNYVKTDFDDGAGGKDEPGAILVRAQLAFK